MTHGERTVLGRDIERTGGAGPRESHRAQADAAAQLLGRQNALDHARSAQRVSDVPLEAVHRQAAQAAQGECLALHRVVVGRAGAVRVGEAERFARNAGLGQRLLDGVVESVARARGTRNVVGVVRDGTAFQHDGRMPGFRRIGREQQGADGFAQGEPVLRRFVVGPAGAGAHRLEREESLGDELREQVAAHDQHVAAVARADHPAGDDQGRYARDAGVGDHRGAPADAQPAGDPFGQRMQIGPGGGLGGRFQQFDVTLGRRHDQCALLRGEIRSRLGGRGFGAADHGTLQRRIPLDGQVPHPVRVDASGRGELRQPHVGPQTAASGFQSPEMLLRAVSQGREQRVASQIDSYRTFHRRCHFLKNSGTVSSSSPDGPTKTCVEEPVATSAPSEARRTVYSNRILAASVGM